MKHDSMARGDMLGDHFDRYSRIADIPEQVGVAVPACIDPVGGQRVLHDLEYLRSGDSMAEC